MQFDHLGGVLQKTTDPESRLENWPTVHLFTLISMCIKRRKKNNKEEKKKKNNRQKKKNEGYRGAKTVLFWFQCNTMRPLAPETDYGFVHLGEKVVSQLLL